MPVSNNGYNPGPYHNGSRNTHYNQSGYKTQDSGIRNPKSGGYNNQVLSQNLEAGRKKDSYNKKDKEPISLQE